MRKKQYVLNTAALIIVGVYLFPIYWMIVTSLKESGDIFRTPPHFFPDPVNWTAYLDQLDTVLARNFMNSMIISLLAMALVVLLSIPAAYGLSRYRVKGKKTFILFFLVSQMLPTTLILTPMFIMFQKVAVLNTLIAPVLANATLGIPFSVLIMRTYFLSAPKELEDAAFIDGCNPFTAFLKIMVPICTPGIIVSAAFSFLFAWGDLIFSLTFVRQQLLWPVTTSIYNAMGQYGLEWNTLMAFATIMVLPVIALFIFLQRYLVDGLTAGSIK